MVMANQMVSTPFLMSVEGIFVYIYFFCRDVKVVDLVGWHKDMFFNLFEGKTIKKEQKKATNV